MARTTPSRRLSRIPRGRLASLGHASYAAYLKSPHWRRTRRRYRESGLPQACFLCGDDDVDLHHRTYVRLGEERLEDLVPLCRADHQLVHVLERRGDITLDLAGLLSELRASPYSVEERARRAVARRDFYSRPRPPTSTIMPGSMAEQLGRYEALTQAGTLDPGPHLDAIRRAIERAERKVLTAELRGKGVPVT